MLTALLDRLLDACWPRRCLACDGAASGAFLCDACVVTLVPTAAGVTCPRCGLPWLEGPAGGAHACGPCLTDPPPWARARAAFAYGGALRDAIARWKNVPLEPHGPRLAALMATQATAVGWDRLAADTLVVPVPAHGASLRARGFNPAGVLAAGLARALGLGLAPTALGVRKPPASSKGLSRAARRRRLVGVFRGDRARLAGREVLLVDDVMTTGATARAAAGALRRAGAARVEVAVLARPPVD